ncbi:Exosome complex exonuclease rrp6 [Psilocybe cubensis]|uniref:HRDC domain-containing protein n=2 Tax=Psilocybe cubensis TaxID=181762 RepID=A0A8H8CFJ0_PSICU|nr:Exosome complex exonuclease rrp6 [Psilocybe cubensis]KAH9480124.1 Exosome complex exonuclease rrp6 [Psilocybe cubensis]
MDSLASTSFDAYNARLQASALTATRKSAGLPADLAFHRSMDRDLEQELDAFSQRVLGVTNKLLGLVSTQSRKGKAKLENEDDVVDNFHALVVDSMDQLLERTDICLDEFWGKNKAPAIAINPPKPKKSHTGEKGHVVQHAANLSKPQLLFPKKADNSDSPWYPTLSHKYNAKVPLGHIYTDENDTGIISNHPYRYEITHLNYPPRMFTQCTPIQPPSLEDTQATWVGTKEDFARMLDKLRKATEIAVDLEHHSYRSYSGFLCLMQISDREEDWIIDLLTLRSEIESLNEVFTNPEIVKVFHGADSDIVWLQQDFNVYIVNLFDTFHASKLLEFPRHGLANLLEMYCDFVPDKRYQLADWRIRPLPEDMLKYARSDTHFLLYIYDNLRNALLDRSRSQSQSRAASASPPPLASSSTPSPPQGLLDETLSRSAETSLRVYSKEPYDATDGTGSGGWDTLAKKWNKVALTAGGPGVGVGALQREVYKSVHGWRERVAREEDESTRYVLQNHALFLIAEQPPADMAALLALFRSSVPPVVKRRARELLSVIKDSVKRGMVVSRMSGQGSADDRPEPVPQAEEKRKDVVMLEAEMKNLEKDETPSTSIWGQCVSFIPSHFGARGANIATAVDQGHSTSRSTLFGTTRSSSKVPIASARFATSVSTLFGNGVGKKASAISSAASSGHRSGHPQFDDLVAKINRSFSMAPAIPQVGIASLQAAVDTPAEPSIKEEGASGMQVEIPYVAPAQRQSKPIKEEKDTIVVVGQARQKRKRKEAKATFTAGGDLNDSASKDERVAKLDSDKPAEMEHFDFSAVPNILDDNPDLEDRKKKRQRKQPAKAGTFYGDFPAPPKAHSELKSGNQSHTFK